MAGVAVGRVEVQDVDGSGDAAVVVSVGVHGRALERGCAIASASSLRGSEDRGHAARLAVLPVLADEPIQLGPAGDVALDELDAVVVVDGTSMTATRPAMRWGSPVGMW